MLLVCCLLLWRIQVKLSGIYFVDDLSITTNFAESMSYHPYLFTAILKFIFSLKPDGYVEKSQTCVLATNLQDLALMVGVSPKDQQNLEDVFTAVAEGDERPLLRLGMPRSNWMDVQFMLNKLIEGGLSS
ncbi:hypothetical protein ACJMK2_038183 [Sinanodonta woodiana]|uniref:Uncharacterized protein n=1 Tax=Sinanodonta woodiana TaxID=1069815 RepID=A0ABD3WMR3_SINWO